MRQRACVKIVKDNDIALECEGFCKKWFHETCVNIYEDEYDEIYCLSENVKW